MKYDLSSSNKKKFDILFALNGLPLAISGGSRIIVTLVNILKERGYKIGVIVLQREPWHRVLSKDAPTAKALQLLLKLNDSPLTYRFFNPLFRFIFRSPSYLKINKGTKFVTQSTVKKYDCHIYIATNFINAIQLKSIGIQLENIILFSQIDETDSRYSGRYSDLAIDTYKEFPKRLFINEDLLRRFPGSKKIGMAIDLSHYILLNPIDSRIPDKIVFIIRKGEQKDPDTAISAMNKIHLAAPDVRISAYGNLNKGDVPDFVDYHYKPSDREVVTLLNSSSIFVITSVLEGYPVPPLEAMACGCAVISTDSVGVREYLIHGVNGIICPAKNPDMLVKYVIQYVADNYGRIEIAKSGYKTAIDHSHEKLTTNFLDAINSY